MVVLAIPKKGLRFEWNCVRREIGRFFCIISARKQLGPPKFFVIQQGNRSALQFKIVVLADIGLLSGVNPNYTEFLEAHAYIWMIIRRLGQTTLQSVIPMSKFLALELNLFILFGVLRGELQNLFLKFLRNGLFHQQVDILNWTALTKGQRKLFWIALVIYRIVSITNWYIIVQESLFVFDISWIFDSGSIPSGLLLNHYQ